MVMDDGRHTNSCFYEWKKEIEDDNGSSFLFFKPKFDCLCDGTVHKRHIDINKDVICLRLRLSELVPNYCFKNDGTWLREW